MRVMQRGSATDSIRDPGLLELLFPLARQEQERGIQLAVQFRFMGHRHQPDRRVRRKIRVRKYGWSSHAINRGKR
jgi:hypothetical protein